MTELQGRTSSNIKLPEAIQECKAIFDNGVALLYSPRFCQLAQLDSNGNLTNAQGNTINLDYDSDYIFEARLFNSDYELRWLNEFEGQGQAVLLSEKDISSYFKESTSLACLDTIHQRYLLWGESTNTQLIPGWQRLATARIGALDIPLSQPVSKNQRVYLNTVEYLAEVDQCGNVAVVEERLVNFEVK